MSGTERRELSAAELEQLLLEVQGVVADAEKRRTHTATQRTMRWSIFGALVSRLSGGLGFGEKASLPLAVLPGDQPHPPPQEGKAAETDVEQVPATPEQPWRAAAKNAEAAEAELAERTKDVDELFAPQQARKETDAVRIAKITASVDRERTAAVRVQELRKIESTERIEALRRPLEELIAKMKDATDRAVATEGRLGELERERVAGGNALAVEKKRGFSTYVVAVVALIAGVAGALIEACAKSGPAAPGAAVAASATSPPRSTTPSASNTGPLPSSQPTSGPSTPPAATP